MTLLHRNVDLAGRREMSPWRRIALSAWPTVSDASIHAVVEIDAAPVLRYIDGIRARTGEPVALVHCVGKMLALMLRELPEVNCLLRCGRLYRRRHVDVFFPVAMDTRGEELSGVVLRRVDTVPVTEVARRLSREAVRLRRRGDAGFRGVKGWLLGPLLMRTAGFFLYTLNVWSPLVGFPRDAFGSAAVSDLTRFGATIAFPPLLPIARLPLVIGIAPVDHAPGDDGRTRPILRLCLVLDHRIIDGVLGGRICQSFRRIMAAPEAHLDAGPPGCH